MGAEGKAGCPVCGVLLGHSLACIGTSKSQQKRMSALGRSFDCEYAEGIPAPECPHVTELLAERDKLRSLVKRAIPAMESYGALTSGWLRDAVALTEDME